MSQFECREPKCTEQVKYVPNPITAFTVSGKAQSLGTSSEETVYLTCALGHTHRYVVSS